MVSRPSAAHASRQPLVGLSSRVKGCGRLRLVLAEEKKSKWSAPEEGAAWLLVFFPRKRLACSPFLGPVIMGVTCSLIQ